MIEGLNNIKIGLSLLTRMTFISSMQRSKKIFTLMFLTSTVGVLAFQQPLIMAQVSSTPLSVRSSLSIVSLFNQAQHSIVQVTSKSLQNTSEIGSGFVYDRAGHILTASHVVDGSKIVDVIFIDGNRYSAKVIGMDPYSDFTVLQITDKINNEALNPLMLGNSSKLEVGEPVIAIGHSFPGVGLENTLTTGVISQTKYHICHFQNLESSCPMQFKQTRQLILAIPAAPC